MLRHMAIRGAFTLLLVDAGLEARAEFLRCNGDLAGIGDNKAAVTMKCGEPVAKDSFCKPGEGACQRVDEWTYNPGPGQFLTILRFENGVLVSIRYGDRIR